MYALGRFIFVGKTPPTKMEQWLLKLVNSPEFGEFGAMAIVGFPKDRNSEIGAFTANFAMGAPKLAEAATQLHFDAIEEYIRVNLGRYRSMDIDEDGFGIEPDKDPCDDNEE